MIQAVDLEKSFGSQVLFNKASFTVGSGERVGLVGRNGHGKTTLFRIILGQERPDGGSISFPKNYSINHLDQHIRFTGSTVLDEACQALRPSDDGTDESYRVKAVLQGLGFSESDFSISPHALSGGYQVRLNLAKVLVSEPNLLLLDEPTNYLDIVSLRWLKRFLKEWKNELILITHDREFMDSVTTHTMGIHRRKIRKIEGSTHKLYSQILQEEEIHEQSRINDEKKRAEIERFINRFRVQATRAKAVQSRIRMLGKKQRVEKLSAIETLDFSFNYFPTYAKWLLQAEDLSFSFDEASPPLISHLNLTVQKHDRIAVIGKNGKGKTTLLNLLAGDLQATSGRINLHRDARIAYFGQTNIDRLDHLKTVEEEILQLHPEHNRREARGICGTMMFEGDSALKKVGVLSGGERSRVLLGKLLVHPSNLLLLDEPTNHLDMESTESLIEAVDAFDGALVIVTHSEMILDAIAQKLIVFDKGTITVFDGTYREFIDKVGWQDEATSSSPKPAEKTGNGISKKDLRRLRAEIVSEKGKVLGTLRSSISEIEDEIVLLEQRVEQNTNILLDLSRNGGDGAKMGELSKEIHEANDRIELLFHDLERLTTEHDDKAALFEKRISETEALP